MKARTVKKLYKNLNDKGVEYVIFQFSDMFGDVKSTTKPLSEFTDAAENGVWFDGSSIKGYVRISESDMLLMPDLSTLAVLPWRQTHARVICDVLTPDGKPFAGDPRSVLKDNVQKARMLGFEYNVGPEVEFFLFEKAQNGELVPHDSAGYFDFDSDEGFALRREITQALNKLGLHIEMDHHEVAPGQHEIDFRYGDALSVADNVQTLKYTIRAIAKSFGLEATFMPKPFFGENGSGMHVHQSLADTNTGENKFFDPEDEYNLSGLARSFIEGQLRHAKALAAVVAPTVNSYKRLVPGYEAPVYICWGRTNRSALVRIPRAANGKEAEATRAELRCPDPSSNPYLAFSAMLAAGLDGVSKELELRPPFEESTYEISGSRDELETLPASLQEALDALDTDYVVLHALGWHIYKSWKAAKRAEWDEYRLQVSSWELATYL